MHKTHGRGSNRNKGGVLVTLRFSADENAPTMEDVLAKIGSGAYER